MALSHGAFSVEVGVVVLAWLVSVIMMMVIVVTGVPTIDPTDEREERHDSHRRHGRVSPTDRWSGAGQPVGRPAVGQGRACLCGHTLLAGMVAVRLHESMQHL